MSDSEEVKVVDKRRFTDDSDHQSTEDHPEKDGDSKLSEKIDDNLLEKDTETSPPAGEMSFGGFLFGIYSQTLIFLGEVPHPETGEVQANLEAAKHNIDLLSILEEKTKGNLDKEESELMNSALNNLRLRFVEKKK